MQTTIAKSVLSLDFDGTWETLIPILDNLLDSATEWLDRENEYHTTQVMTILIAFQSIASSFGCKASENPVLFSRYKLLARRLKVWFQQELKAGARSREKFLQIAEAIERACE